MANNYAREALEEYERISMAWQSQAISLLGKPYAQTYISIFRVVFRDTTRQVPDDELYEAMDSIKAAFDEADLGDAWPRSADESGRDFCRRRLMRQFGWLQSEQDGTNPGHETYRLSQNAMRILNAIDELVNEPRLASSDLMSIVIENLEKLAAQTTGDREERARYLRRRIDDAQRELDELEAGGDVTPITEEEAEERVATLVNLLREFPVSFMAVAAELDEGARNIDKAYKDGTPIGVIERDYFRESSDLLKTTQGGRNFLGTVAAMSGRSFTDKVDAIASSPVLKDASAARRTLWASWDQVTHGMQRVFDSFARARDVMTAYNRTFESDERMVLRDALLQCKAAAWEWAETARPRTLAPLPLAIPETTIESLATSVSDVGADATPDAPKASRAAVRPHQRREPKYGEPDVARIASELLELAKERGLGPEVDVADLWGDLPDRDRRLADAVAMGLRMSERGDAGTADWATHSPEGVESTYDGPRLVTNLEALERLSTRTNGGR